MYRTCRVIPLEESDYGDCYVYEQEVYAKHIKCVNVALAGNAKD